MRILVVGAGGVGGWLGGALQRAGASVGFVARGAQLAALRHHGLRLEHGATSTLVAPGGQLPNNSSSCTHSRRATTKSTARQSQAGLEAAAAAPSAQRAAKASKFEAPSAA
jgi:ketopantoate reductase